jgi:hypothetical protein
VAHLKEVCHGENCNQKSMDYMKIILGILSTNYQNAFLTDGKAQNMANGTLYFDQMKLKLFSDFCDSQL